MHFWIVFAHIISLQPHTFTFKRFICFEVKIFNKLKTRVRDVCLSSYLSSTDHVTVLSLSTVMSIRNIL